MQDASRNSTSHDLVAEVEAAIEGGILASGGDTTAQDPGHRIPFHWPPSHDLSVTSGVLRSDWRQEETVEYRGETILIKFAKVRDRLIGRSEKYWNEAEGSTIDEIIATIQIGLDPLFDRLDRISECIGRDFQYGEAIWDLEPRDLVRLLYCSDRDVAHEAMLAIETHASEGVFCRAVTQILRDNKHPLRRVAQWCVLDLMEDLPAICKSCEEQSEAVQAIKDLMWDAEDDYARCIYKAGVVLGGHICTEEAASALLECFEAPSKFARRSAIHAVFHLVEWMPESKPRVLEKLERASRSDEEPLLRDFAGKMYGDIESGDSDHHSEPLFPDEIAKLKTG